MIAGLLLAVAVSQAPPPAAPDAVQMRSQMHDYFDGEWTEAYFWLAGGVPALGSGVGLLAGGNQAFKGAAAPLLLFGVIQTVAGIFLFGRTRGQVRALDAQLDADPRAYAAAATKRMEGVNRGFAWYRPVELAFLGLGAVLAANGVYPKNDLLLGMGIATMAEAVVMLVFDHFAGERAERYAAQLRAFVR